MLAVSPQQYTLSLYSNWKGNTSNNATNNWQVPLSTCANLLQ